MITVPEHVAVVGPLLWTLVAETPGLGRPAAILSLAVMILLPFAILRGVDDRPREWEGGSRQPFRGRREGTLKGPRLIINADDLGISDAVTRDIFDCLEAGRLTSATIMANGDAFEAACEGVHRLGLTSRVGVHLNLTSGPPLTEGMALLCDERLDMSVPERRLLASRPSLALIAAELRAQIQRVVDAGIRPSHIDSHQHIINGLPYVRVALRVAREFGISRVRLTRNAFYDRSLSKAAFKTLYNRYLRWRGFTTTQWFTDVKPYFLHVHAGGSHLPRVTELMTHPGASLDQAIYGAGSETELLMSDALADFLRRSNPISYADLS